MGDHELEREREKEKKREKLHELHGQIDSTAWNYVHVSLNLLQVQTVRTSPFCNWHVIILVTKQTLRGRKVLAIHWLANKLKEKFGS